MEQSIQYGTTTIDYTLKRTERKTLSIEVHPDLEIKVIAPLDAKPEQIEAKILKRASWIVKQLNYFESFLPRIPKREYVSGETHLYLGRRYMLKIKLSDKNEVKLKGGNIIVYKKNIKQNSDRTRRLLAQWYLKHGERKFNQHFNKAFESFGNYNIDKPGLEIRRMKNRWGSHTTKGKIILNPELIKAPVICIDYVIIHELCHTIHKNHSKEFYNLLEVHMPGWKQVKERLERIIVNIT